MLLYEIGIIVLDNYAAFALRFTIIVVVHAGLVLIERLIA